MVAKKVSKVTDSDDITDITGTLLFGPMVNWMLYGVLCVQTYVYSYNFQEDRRSLKFLAYFIFLLETVQTALTGADVYYWFVIGFGNVKVLVKNNFSPIDGQVISAPISFIVQGYYCYRIWTLQKRWWPLCLIIAILSLSQAIASLTNGITGAIFRTYAILEPSQYVWLVTSALADILIAGAMVLLLRETRSYEGRYASHVLARVVRLTVETNALTAAMTIIAFLLQITFPHKILYIFPITILGKLYSNTFFLTLNNRIYFRDHPPGKSSGSMSRHQCSTRQDAAATSPLRFVQATSSQLATISVASVKPGPVTVLPTPEGDSDV